MCRDIDMSKLKGIIYDNACNFHNYLLNREPREWQFLRCLVDGAHYRGHKKTKKEEGYFVLSTAFMLQ